jgi:c-di-GMP-binding flagellar brake protein YcgR
VQQFSDRNFAPVWCPQTGHRYVEMNVKTKSHPTEQSNCQGESNRREAFRVPLWGSCGLTVEGNLRGQSLSARALDISLTGILLVFDADEAFELELGQPIQLTLRLDSDEQVLQAVFRRRQGEGYGLYFPETMQHQHAQSPQRLNKMVMELQRRWVARRVR